MGWHCDMCGGHSSYSAQGFRTSCTDCGHVEGDSLWPVAAMDPADRRAMFARLGTRIEALAQRDTTNRDPRGRLS